jgi:Domain of unknown function (DUF4276)
MHVEVTCVVEGKGEEQALPILVRRVAERVDPSLAVSISRPVLLKRNRLNELEQRVQLAVNKLQGPGGVFVVLDADADCPAQLGPQLLGRAMQVCRAMPVGVVLAKREFEAWFLAAAESVGGQRSLCAPLLAPPDPESIADAKGWLRRRMPSNRKYSETSDQPALTAVFDMDLARSHSDSFDKCYREIENLLRALLRSASPLPPLD